VKNINQGRVISWPWTTLKNKSLSRLILACFKDRLQG